MKIGIDFDNVLANTAKTYLDIYNNFVTANYTINDITKYEISEILPQEHQKLLENMWTNDLLWNNIQPLQDSQLYVNMLSKKYDIYIVTSTHPEIAGIKFAWLQKQYPFIEAEKFITIYKKQMLDLDIMIDDHVKNLVNSRYSGILLNYPWNTNFHAESEHNIYRAENWKEIYDIIESGVI